MKEITLETKISDLLNNYKGMEERLIEINPKFKKLKNPILRRTLAKVAGVKQAAIVGGMDPLDLLNQLRDFVGQKPLDIPKEDLGIDEEKPSPEWIKSDFAITLDASKLLDEQKNPLAEANKALKKLKDGEILGILADFKPQPLIDEFEKSGHEVYSKEEENGTFFTFIKK